MFEMLPAMEEAEDESVLGQLDCRRGIYEGVIAVHGTSFGVESENVERKKREILARLASRDGELFP